MSGPGDGADENWASGIQRAFRACPMRRTAGEQVAPGLWDTVRCDEKVKRREDLELLVDSRPAENHVVELFAARKMVAVQLAAERAAARSTRIAESGGACDQGISTGVCEKIKKAGRGKVALCKGRAKLAAKNKLQEVFTAIRMGRES